MHVLLITPGIGKYTIENSYITCACSLIALSSYAFNSISMFFLFLGQRCCLSCDLVVVIHIYCLSYSYNQAMYLFIY